MIALAYVVGVWVAVALGLTTVWVVLRGFVMTVWWMRDKGIRR